MKFFKNLLQRRVPQILGIYLGAAWAIIEFLDWLINQFSISPHVPSFVLLILVAMIPTVVLIAYFHGKPGKDEWTRVEKIGIPANVVAAVLMLIFVFQGKDLGATSSIVTLEDEEGQVIERVVPKSEFRKKVMVFFLDNETGDSALNWLSYGFCDMIHTDLMQDIYLEIRTGFEPVSSQKMKEAGFAELTGLPLLLEKQIARDLHLDYFLTGSYKIEDQKYRVDAELYHTRNGKLINKITLLDENVFELVDMLSVQVKQDLQIPDYHIQETDDLPVSEISSSSLEAYEHYCKGAIAHVVNSDWNGTLLHLNEAIMADSTFALALFYMYQMHFLTGQSDKAGWIFTPLMKNLYKLPEKLQFYVKASYYEQLQEFEKQYAIFEMVVELYPDDIQAWLNLITIYRIRNEMDKAIAGYQHILDLDPERYSILTELGEIYRQQGKYEEALKYCLQYAEHFPNRAESFRSLGNLYKGMGDFGEARNNYEKSLLLEPGSISDMLLVADLESKTGNFDRALKQLHTTLEQSTNAKDKANVYDELQSFHKLRGELDRALEYLYLKQAEWDSEFPPILVTISKIASFNQFAALESKERSFSTLEILGTQLDTMLKDYISIGYLFLYLKLEETAKAEAELLKAENLIETMKIEVLRPFIFHAQGKIYELREEYAQATDQYLAQLEMDPTDKKIYVNLGRCYRMQDSFKESEEITNKALEIDPFCPEANYEMALVCFERGKKEEAMEHLNRVLSVWENADPDFEPAIMAQTTFSEWSQ